MTAEPEGKPAIRAVVTITITEYEDDSAMFALVCDPPVAAADDADHPHDVPWSDAPGALKFGNVCHDLWLLNRIMPLEVMRTIVLGLMDMVGGEGSPKDAPRDEH